jgi:nicotinamide-nucleotide amidase
MTNASIITIGDELLIGQVTDTNSGWIGQRLQEAGIHLRRRVAVGDNEPDIVQALNNEKKEADIILITGGLGPTSDDITKDVLCAYFKGKLIVHEPTLTHIRNLFEQVMKKPLLQRNLLQAEVPDNCRVIENSRGTAPGMWFEENGKVIISMPGVPHEMMGMMDDIILPGLSQQFKLPFIVHRTLMTIGAGESTLAELIAAFEEALPENVSLAYLPNFGQVRLRLSSSGTDKKQVENLVDSLFVQLQSLVKDYLVTTKDESMQEVVGRLLSAKSKTISTAESCTGGYIAHLLTSKPGASVFYEGSVVSYSYQAKENLLQVDSEVLKTKGAVSEQVVVQMAKGALSNIGSDYVIAVSGIMGPDGGLPDKPVGTVWVAVGNREKINARMFSLRSDRQRNIQVTAVLALNMLREFLLNE